MIKENFNIRIADYDDSLRNERIWEQYVSGALEGALEKGEIVPFLQPQVDFTGECIGAEMLMRWNHPTEGFLSPARFIPIIEKNGLIAKADAYVFPVPVAPTIIMFDFSISTPSSLSLGCCKRL